MKTRQLITLSITVLFIIGLLLSITGCKKIKLEDVSWILLDGSGTYSSTDNTSSIKLHARIQINQSNIARDLVTASIEDWRFTISNGNQTAVILQKSNYHQILGKNVYLDISGTATDFLWLNIESIIPISGDIFNGVSPITVTSEMLLVDDNGNTITVENTGTFQMTKN
ncbi:MAG: hypothetical protein ACM3SY_20375 [Candidatus Omnitrophota bacterium]